FPIYLPRARPLCAALGGRSQQSFISNACAALDGVRQNSRSCFYSFKSAALRAAAARCAATTGLTTVEMGSEWPGWTGRGAAFHVPIANYAIVTLHAVAPQLRPVQPYALCTE